MKKEGNDMRTRISQGIIKNSLIELLKEKEIQKISVTEVCKKANINRGTFYNHFVDINDVYETIQDDFYNNITSRLETKNVTVIDGAFFKELLHYIAQNDIIAKMIIKEFYNSKLLSRLIAYTENKYINDFHDVYPSIPSEKITDLSTYTINGTLGLMVKVIRDGRLKDLDYFTNLILTLNEGIVKDFISRIL